MQENKKLNFLINVFYTTLIVFIFYFSIKWCFGYIFPLVIGVLSAFFSYKTAVKISNKIKLPVKVLSLITVILLYLVVILAAWLIMGIVYKYFKTTNFDLQNTLNDIFSLSFVQKIIQTFGLDDSHINQALSSVFSTLAEWISSFARKLPSLLFNIFISVLTGCYLAWDFQRIKKFFFGAFELKYIEKFAVIKRILSENVFKILKSYVILAFITSVMLFIGFLILKVNSPISKAIIIALVDILPVLGVGTVLIPWAVFCFFTDKITMGIGLIILFILITVVRNVTEPKIIGKQVGINPIITLFSMFLGLKIFGAVGLFIVPLIMVVLIKYAEEIYLKNVTNDT